MALPSGARRSGEHQLSMNVLQMKFMQRSRKRIAREKSQAKQQQLKKQFLPDRDAVLPEASSQPIEVIKEHRWDVLENLVFGRQSFLGFNPQVEKYFAYHEAVRMGVEYESEGEASDAADGSGSEREGADDTGNREDHRRRGRDLPPAKAKWSNATFADPQRRRQAPKRPAKQEGDWDQRRDGGGRGRGRARGRGSFGGFDRGHKRRRGLVFASDD